MKKITKISPILGVLSAVADVIRLGLGVTGMVLINSPIIWISFLISVGVSLALGTAFIIAESFKLVIREDY